MHTSVSQSRVVGVFNDTMEQIRTNKKPSISGIMRRRGYSKSSARALTAIRTKTWQELLLEIDDDMLKTRLVELAGDKQDKRASLTAIDMLLKLKDRYPATKQQWQGQLEARGRYYKQDDTNTSPGEEDTT